MWWSSDTGETRPQILLVFMTRFFVPLLVATALLVVALPEIGRAQESEFPSISDTAPPPAAAPEEKDIQKAVLRCLSASDASSGGAPRRGQGRGLVEEGEDRYCIDQKRACHLDPGSFACRNFVQDYTK